MFLLSLTLSWVALAAGPVVHHVLATPDEAVHFALVKTKHDWSVIEVGAGGAIDVGVRQAFERHDDWLVDLHLLDRRRLLVPPRDRRYPSARTQAYLIYPDRAPVRLTEVGASSEVLARLNLTGRGAPVPVPRPRPKDVRIPADPYVILTSANDAARISILHHEGLIAGPGTPTKTDLVAVVPAVIVDSLLRDARTPAVVVYPTLAALRSEQRVDDALATLANEKATLVEVVRALVALSRRPAEWPEDVSWAALRRGLARFANVLDGLRTALPPKDLEYTLRRDHPNWSHYSRTKRGELVDNAVRRTELETKAIAPLRDLYAEVLTGFAKVADPRMARLLLRTAAPAGRAGTRLISDDTWFTWFDERLGALTQLPVLKTHDELKAEGWFVDLPRADTRLSARGLTLIDARPPVVANDFGWEIARLPPWPLRWLGHEVDQIALRERLLGYLIAADYRVAAALPSLRRHRLFDAVVPFDALPAQIDRIRAQFASGKIEDPDVDDRLRVEVKRIRLDGSAALDRVIRTLGWAPPEFLLDPGFDLARYHENAVELLIDVLSTAGDVLKTSGTYHSALNVAVELTHVEPRGDHARERQIVLDGIVGRLTRGHLAAVGCAADLTPDRNGVQSWRDESST